MTQSLIFGQVYISAVQSLITDLENLRTLGDRYVQDNTLFAGYAASVGARTDISAADLVNAYNAVVQLLSAFDTGNPTSKSYLFKLL